MNNKYLFILIAGLFFSASIYSQEKLVSAGQNHINGTSKPHFKSGVLLTLPFIDDFSTSKPYPDPSKWTDNNAYINNTYAINQPGYGVATLDAIDSLGRVYSHASINPFRADYLTSQYIDLNTGADSTVYLSFYYQAQGLGDMPEPGDSLVLEFYSPDNQSWNWAWSTPGLSMDEFEHVLVNIKGAAYLQEGFRFRFVNYASLSNSFEPSLKYNVDHWHLDYIYLNNNRNYQDLILPDLSLIDPAGNLLLEYSSMPWEHYKTVGISAVNTLFPIHIQNLAGTRHFYTPRFSIEDINGSGGGYDITLEPEEITSLQKLIYEAPFNYSFESDDQDSASFRITLDLQPVEEDLIPGNTKLETIQEFSNYYAYDDGSAEAGYGLVGEGANNGRVAYRFENFVPSDSLKGVEIFFNKSFDNANLKYFNLAIWNEIDGQPGEEIYRMNGLRSGFNQGLTGFDSFSLDTAQVVPPVFYIGWIQVTSDFLNIGYDRNTNNNDKIFYTMDGVWKPTGHEGSLMIRPVFANKSKKTGITNFEFPVEVESLKVYPNPASRHIYLEYPANWENAKLYLIDLYGRTVLTQNRISSQIDLPSIDTGTYFLIIKNTDGQSFNKKLLITHE